MLNCSTKAVQKLLELRPACCHHGFQFKNLIRQQHNRRGGFIVEIDAIALAEELNASLLLMDDDAGVRFALARGLAITGTLGVLVEAAQIGMVEIELVLEKLKRSDFRATPELYERARNLAFGQTTHAAAPQSLIQRTN